MLPIISFLSLIFFGTTAIAADAVPTINVRPSCQAAASGMIGLKQDIDVCLRSEQNVRDQLAKEWTQFPAADRASCTRLTTMSRAGTYTELLTCLEMKRDARKLPKEGTIGEVTR